MTRFLTVVASASALALVSVAAPGTAEARCVGCAVGAGIVGGIAAGAIIAGATANRGYGYYDGAYAYEPAYGYGYGSGYAYEPGYAYSEPVYGGYYGYRHRRAYSTGDLTNMDRQLQGTRKNSWLSLTALLERAPIFRDRGTLRFVFSPAFR